MDSSVNCPFCHLTLPPSQLQRHANSHFDEDDGVAEKDEQLARDLELAQQLSIPPPSSTFTLQENNTMDEKISCLIALQYRSSFYHVKSPELGF